jgi:hypothetical protein
MPIYRASPRAKKRREEREPKRESAKRKCVKMSTSITSCLRCFCQDLLKQSDWIRGVRTCWNCQPYRADRYHLKYKPLYYFAFMHCFLSPTICAFALAFCLLSQSHRTALVPPLLPGSHDPCLIPRYRWHWRSHNGHLAQSEGAGTGVGLQACRQEAVSKSQRRRSCGAGGMLCRKKGAGAAQKARVMLFIIYTPSVATPAYFHVAYSRYCLLICLGERIQACI